MDKIEIQQLISFSKSINVLYVEDNQEARSQTIKVLENFFSNIIIGIDGLDGLEKFKNNKIDLIITDINMPKLNGLDMIEQIKKIDNEVFCLVISAYNETEYLLKAIELGVDGFLLKPVKINMFLPLLTKTIQNIKNRQEAKNSYIQQTKLATMGEMIDSIAHQWKQPLSIISMKLQALKIAKDYGNLNDSLIDESVSSIDMQIQHLLQTLNEFRNFCRPNTNIENVSLKSLIESALLLIKDILISNSIKTKIDIDENIVITTNVNEFKHIILNIVNNAKDAFIENNISKKIRQLVFTASVENNKLILDITDNAGGINPDILPYIFEPNFTTKQSKDGTGMGLYMTKQIIHKNDADIIAFNTNDGVSFRITQEKISKK